MKRTALIVVGCLLGATLVGGFIYEAHKNSTLAARSDKLHEHCKRLVWKLGFIAHDLEAAPMTGFKEAAVTSLMNIEADVCLNAEFDLHKYDMCGIAADYACLV